MTEAKTCQLLHWDTKKKQSCCITWRRRCKVQYYWSCNTVHTCLLSAVYHQVITSIRHVIVSPKAHLLCFTRIFEVLLRFVFFYFHCERTIWFKCSLVRCQSRIYHRKTLVMLNLLKSILHLHKKKKSFHSDSYPNSSTPQLVINWLISWLTKLPSTTLTWTWV